MMQGADAGRGMVLVFLPENGARVRKGQQIAVIDGEFLREHLSDMEAQVGQLDMDLRKLGSQQSAEMEAARQRVRAAKAHFDQVGQDMRAADIRTTIDREMLKLSFEEARATWQDAENEIALIEQRQTAERRIAEINRESQVRHRDRHRSDILHFTVNAPMDGQAVLKPINRNGQMEQVRVGDQLSAGQPFMRVVDLGHMRLDGVVSQSDSELMRLGQRATIHFDAYPDLVLNGRVESVGALAVSGRRTSYYVRTIPVRIAIEESDPRVIPDLTASADVVLEEDEGIVIPREAVQESAGKPVVLVRQGETVTPRPVEIGTFSDTQVSVTAGIQEGDEIALQPETAK
jgi:membrane fusion protein (multidrug efflux system)